MTQKSQLLLWAASALLVAAPVHAKTEQCHRSSDREIAALFDRWNTSLQSGDPAKVAANYAKDSVLLPTLSNQPRLTQEEKEQYFKGFLKKKPVGKIDERAIRIDCNTALDVGLYTFRFGDGTQAKGRFTFTYKWDGQQWLITSHHSSLMPQDN
jgi:uncharacterized protein (TIGR02246 family)